MVEFAENLIRAGIGIAVIGRHDFSETGGHQFDVSLAALARFR